MERSGSECELCSAADELLTYDVQPNDAPSSDHCVLVCKVCLNHIDNPSTIDADHFQPLGTNMWSEIGAVKVMAYRIFKFIGPSSWAVSQLDQLYLDDQEKAWAEAGLTTGEEETKDSNGTPLKPGDSVTLIKDLVVKGAGFKAKRGTMVKNISLTDNPKHIEGRVNGTRIVLVAAYLKKS